MSDYLTPLKSTARRDLLELRNSLIYNYQRECYCGLIDLARKDESPKVITEFTSNNNNVEIYNKALNNSLQTLENFHLNPEDNWLEAIDNVFVEKIINNVEILKESNA